MPSDEPNRVAAVTQMLYRNTDFEVTVLGFDATRKLSMHRTNPHIGATMHDFDTREFIKYRCGETQTHWRKIWNCLGNGHTDDLRIELSYVSGHSTTVSNDQDYEEIPVIEYLLRFLGERAQREQSQELPAIGWHAEHPANGFLSLASYGIVDAVSLSQIQQKTTVLVASTAITCSPFRHRRLKNILYNWNGSVLAFPSG